MRGRQKPRYFYADVDEWKTAPDGVRYTTFSNEPGNPDRPLVVLSQLPPNHVEPPHSHGCDYIEVVIDGTITVGKAAPMHAGDARAMPAGVGYGPLVAGAEGCCRITIFEKAGRSMMSVKGAAAGS